MTARLGLSKFEFVPDDLNNVLMSLLWRASGVHQHDSCVFSRRNRQIGSMYAHKESAAFVLKPVFVGFAGASFFALKVVASFRALYACRNVRIHQDGELRLKIIAKDAMQFQNQFAA